MAATAEVHTEGLQWILEVCFSEEQSVPANFYVGLCTDVTIDEDASLGDLTEVTGTGYGRPTIASNNTDWTSAAAGTNDRKVTAKSVTFTSTADDWDAAYSWFMATTVDDSGKLIASGNVEDYPVTVEPGTPLDIDYIILQGNG